MTISALSNLSPEKKWYLDACTFKEGPELKSFIGLITTQHNKHNRIMVMSHLAIGEATSTCLNKHPGEFAKFIELISTLVKENCLQIVGNDQISTQLDGVLEVCNGFDFTDQIHLATALKYRCEEFKTTDTKILNLRKKDREDLARKNSLEKFVISNPSHSED